MTTMNAKAIPSFNTDDMPALTKQEMAKLFTQRSNSEARDRLITGNLRLVYYFVNANYYETSYFTYEDIVSTGIIGLIKAVDTYDVTSKCTFATYAATCIRNEIGMALRKIAKKQQEVVFSDLVHDSINGDETNADEILGVLSTNFHSEDPYETVNKTVMYEQVLHSMVFLSSTEQRAIKLYYGIDCAHPYKQGEIAKLMGISQSYVSRLLKTATKKLKLRILATPET